MKGLLKAVNTCPKCHSTYPDDEYDLEDDMCLYCKFPETSDKRPAEFNKDLGFNRNTTSHGELIENFEQMPEKQSRQAEKARNEYKNRKLYKGYDSL